MTSRESIRSESDVAVLASLVADVLAAHETRMSQFTTAFQEQLATFREGEEDRFARLERAIADLKPTPVDPMTHFWSIYKKTADEHVSDMADKCIGNLDTTLLFAGFFSVVATMFIVQAMQSLQPNPSDLTNILLLRILQQNTSFDGTDPLAPPTHVSRSVVAAQCILFVCLSIALFVAFAVVSFKELIYSYARISKGAGAVDEGKKLQLWFLELENRGLFGTLGLMHFIVQCALGLFGIAFIVYLWDFDISSAVAVLVTMSLGMSWFWSMGGFLLYSPNPSEPQKNAPTRPVEDVCNEIYPTALSKTDFWRKDPLFPSPPPEDISASAGAWLLENGADFLSATAVAAIFPESQWPLHRHCTTALTRLRDTYDQCFRAPKFDNSTRLDALQSAAAYYVLYHTKLIRGWGSPKSPAAKAKELSPDLPLDLFLHEHTEEWGGDGVFEYLLRTEDRSEPVKTARFLSYIAPYWFCGDSDSSIQSRPSRLEKMHELIEVLDKSEAFTPATLTNCVLCVGAAMDFPLHPDDLVRVDKSGYLGPTFKDVVEHIHGIALSDGDRRPFAKAALETLLTLFKKSTSPLVDATWVTRLLQSGAEEDMDYDTFLLFLRFSASRAEEADAVDVDPPLDKGYVHVQGPPETVASRALTPEYVLFEAIAKHIKTCSEQEGGWQDDAVYGGLIVIKDIPRLRSCLPEVGFFEMLSDAMEKSKPQRVRQAAYDVIHAAQDGWLSSADLRQTLERLDLPRQLHSVVIENGRADNWHSFLAMMETLSGERYWHSYLRAAMDIWLPFRNEGSLQVLRIFTTVAEIPSLEVPSNLPFAKLVEKEWAAVPGRHAQDLTVDRLKPLVEVTEQIKELLFDESDRSAVFAMVEQVIPSLEKRCDDGQRGPGDGVRRIIGGLVESLRLPPSPSVSS